MTAFGHDWITAMYVRQKVCAHPTILCCHVMRHVLMLTAEGYMPATSVCY